MTVEIRAECSKSLLQSISRKLFQFFRNKKFLRLQLVFNFDFLSQVEN